MFFNDDLWINSLYFCVMNYTCFVALNLGSASSYGSFDVFIIPFKLFSKFTFQSSLKRSLYFRGFPPILRRTFPLIFHFCMPFYSNPHTTMSFLTRVNAASIMVWGLRTALFRRDKLLSWEVSILAKSNGLTTRRGMESLWVFIL